MEIGPIELLRASYNALLGRDPDPSAEADWAATDRSEGSFRTLVARIIQSPEFALRWRSEISASGSGDSGEFFNEHSQFGEVALLLKQMINRSALHRIVVDVGANGRARSNSFDLMRVFGWKGLLIEANPSRIPIIEAEFRGLDMQLVSCAVSDYTGEALLHLGTNDDVSSLSVDATSSWGPVKGGVSVAVRPLADILSEHGIPRDFDLLSVDAEGEDVRIVEALLRDGYRPRWIIVEMSIDGGEVDLAASGLVQASAAGYELIGRTVANLVLLRP